MTTNTRLMAPTVRGQLDEFIGQAQRASATMGEKQ